MKIEVLVLTWNRFNETFRLWQSIKPILGDNLRLTFYDNGSIDKTPEWLWNLSQANPFVNVYLGTRNLGVSGGRNELLKQADADVIGFLDADAYVVNQNFPALILQALALPDVGIVGQGGHIFNKQLKPVPLAPNQYNIKVDVVSGYSMFWKRENMPHPQLVETNNGGVEDDFFCLDFQKKGLKVWCADLGIKHEWGKTWNTSNYSESRKKFEIAYLEWKKTKDS